MKSHEENSTELGRIDRIGKQLDRRRRRGAGLAAAAGLPLAAGLNGTIPAPDLGNIVTSWPGGIAGFAGTVVVGAGAGALYLHEQWKKHRPDGPRTNDKDGFATRRDLRKAYSATAMQKKAAVVRPSFKGVPASRVEPLDVALYAGRDQHHNRDLYLPIEKHVIVKAPPRFGKSAWLAHHVIDAPGAVVAATTRNDLYANTVKLRRQRHEGGRGIHVLNMEPTGLRSTTTFDLVRGCVDPLVARRRSGYMVGATAHGSTMENGSFWDSHAHRILREYMLAADLEGLSLLDVRRWVTNPKDRQALQILNRWAKRQDITPEYRAMLTAWHAELQQAIEGPDKTTQSIYLSLSLAFEFLAMPHVARLVTAQPGVPNFDARAFLENSESLYLVGADRTHGGPGALFAGIVGEIYEVGRVIANELGWENTGAGQQFALPGDDADDDLAANSGRLDPPCRLVLDELAAICPLEIHKWSADAGGAGIQIVGSVQGQAQMEERWGRGGGRTIMKNFIRMEMGGGGDVDELEDMSRLLGEKDETVTNSSTTEDGKRTTSTSVRRVRVMDIRQLREMEPGEAVLVQDGVPPALLTYRPVWERDDVKALAKATASGKKSATIRLGGVIPRQTVTPTTAPPAPVQAAPAAVPTPPARVIPPRPTVPPPTPKPAAPAAPAADSTSTTAPPATGGVGWTLPPAADGPGEHREAG